MPRVVVSDPVTDHRNAVQARPWLVSCSTNWCTAAPVVRAMANAPALPAAVDDQVDAGAEIAASLKRTTVLF
jgi:hypothetical protein